MGGDTTAVSLDTRNIYLEAAFWWPDAIRGRARRYNFSSDAAHRFERGVDFANDGRPHRAHHAPDPRHLRRRARARSTTPSLGLPERKPVTMRIERAARVHRHPDRRRRTWPTSSRASAWPFEARRRRASSSRRRRYRFDLEIEEDLIEEVARVYGFERIPARPAARRRRRCAPRPEDARSLHDVRARARRARLPGSGQLQLRRRGLGARLRRQRDADPRCSIRSPARCRVMRTHADRRPGRERCATT